MGRSTTRRTVPRAMGLMVAALAGGCAVHHPPGYDTLRTTTPVEAVEATPWVPYAMAPHSWDLPDGRRVRIDRAEARAIIIGPRRLRLAFTIRVDGAPHLSLRCRTDPPDVPSRFVCRSETLTAVSYAIAPGPGCSGQGTAALGTLRRPECWRGTLRTGTGTYEVTFAHLERRRWAIDRVSWTDAAGRPVQAADLVAELRIELHRAEGLEEVERDLLMLHALALHQWLQATDS